jgi:hypothetical protein
VTLLSHLLLKLERTAILVLFRAGTAVSYDACLHLLPRETSTGSKVGTDAWPRWHHCRAKMAGFIGLAHQQLASQSLNNAFAVRHVLMPVDPLHIFHLKGTEWEVASSCNNEPTGLGDHTRPGILRRPKSLHGGEEGSWNHLKTVQCSALIALYTHN